METCLRHMLSGGFADAGKDLERRPSWITGTGPKPNDKCPHTRRGRHKQRAEGLVKRETEIGVT